MRLISRRCIMMKLTSKKTWGKRKQHVFRRSWLIHHLQNMSYQEIYTFWNYVVNDELPSTSSQIVEQIEVFQEVVLPGISKLNDWAPDKKQGDQTQFFQNKILEKGKEIWHCLLYLLSNQLMVRVIEWFIKHTRIFFICLKIFSRNEEKTLQLKKDEKKKNKIIYLSKCCVIRLTQNGKNQ